MGNTLSNGIIDSTNRSILTTLENGNDSFSLAKIASEQLGIPTVNEALQTVGDATKRVYTDVRSDITNTGQYISNTTKNVGDGTMFTVTMIYIVIGGTLITFGPQLFDSFSAIAQRLREHGLVAEIKI